MINLDTLVDILNEMTPPEQNNMVIHTGVAGLKAVDFSMQQHIYMLKINHYKTEAKTLKTKNVITQAQTNTLHAMLESDSKDDHTLAIELIKIKYDKLRHN